MKVPSVRFVLPALDAFGWWLAILAMAQTVALIAVMLLEVVLRYGFNAPTLWANDITYMTNGTLFLFGSAWTLRKNAHVRIDFLSTRLPARAQHAINLLFYVLLFLPLLWYVGGSMVHKAHRAWTKGELETMSAWEPLLWPFYAGIALGLLGLAAQVIAESIRHAIGIADPNAVPRPGAHDVHLDVKV